MMHALVLGTAVAAVRTATASEIAAPPCSVAMPPIAFGTLITAMTVPVTVSVTCPNGLRYRLVLEQGSGCAAVRAMTGSDGTYRYTVLTPSGVPWCDGTNGTATIDGIGTGVAQSYVVTAKALDSLDRRVMGRLTDAVRGHLELIP